jgi:hypothetical protein
MASGSAATSASQRTGLPPGLHVAHSPSAGAPGGTARCAVVGAPQTTVRAIPSAMHVETASEGPAFAYFAGALQNNVSAPRDVRRAGLREGPWQAAEEACRLDHAQVASALQRDGSPFDAHCISFLLRDAQSGVAWAVALAVGVSQGGREPEYICLLPAGLSVANWNAALRSAQTHLRAGVKVVEVPVEYESDLGTEDAGLQARYSGLVALRSRAVLEEIGAAQGLTAAVTAAAQRSCARMHPGDPIDAVIVGAVARVKQSREDAAGKATAGSRRGVAAACVAANSSSASAGGSAGGGSFLDAAAAAETSTSSNCETRAAAHELAVAIAEPQEAAAGAGGIDGRRRVSFAPGQPSGACREMGQHAGPPLGHAAAAAEPVNSFAPQAQASGSKRGRAAAALCPPSALAADNVAGQKKRSRT